MEVFICVQAETRKSECFSIKVKDLDLLLFLVMYGIFVFARNIKDLLNTLRGTITSR